MANFQKHTHMHVCAHANGVWLELPGIQTERVIHNVMHDPFLRLGWYHYIHGLSRSARSQSHLFFVTMGAQPPTRYCVQGLFFVTMGAQPPTRYCAQGLFFVTMGDLSPTKYCEGYSLFLLFIYSVVYQHNGTMFCYQIVITFIDKVIEFQG